MPGSRPRFVPPNSSTGRVRWLSWVGLCDRRESGPRTQAREAPLRAPNSTSHGRPTGSNPRPSLAEAGKHVLVVDLDPQGNASTGVGIGHSDREVTIYEVLTAGTDIHGAVLETDVQRLAVVPSTIDLAGAEIELVSQFSRE